jgi:uncharacterized membrane protein
VATVITWIAALAVFGAIYLWLSRRAQRAGRPVATPWPMIGLIVAIAVLVGLIGLVT